MRLRSIFYVLLIVGCGLLIRCSPPSLQDKMKEVVENTNKNCPLPVDQETRLDKMAVTGEKTLQYYYTLLNVDKNSVDINAYKGPIVNQLVNAVKSNPELRYFRDNDLTFIFTYKDLSGAVLFETTISPEFYK